MNMIYWVSTSLLSLILSASALSYLFHQNTISGIADLGFPDFFRLELSVLKLIAALVLIIPHVPLQIKEWAYAGAFFFFVTAIVAHIAHRDSHMISALNVVFIILLIVSNVYLHRAQ